MTDSNFRAITDRERRLIDAILNRSFPGRDEVAAQLEDAMARVVDDDGSLEFQTHGAAPLTSVRYAVPVEAEYVDPDGAIVHVLLHAVGERVTELEFFREDGNKVQSWPDGDAIKVYAVR